VTNIRDWGPTKQPKSQEQNETPTPREHDPRKRAEMNVEAPIEIQKCIHKRKST